MRRILFFSLLLCVTAGLAAQNTNPVVEAKVVPGADGVYPNSSTKIGVVAQVAAGFHINDHKPTLDYLIPTDLKLEPSNEISVEKLVYPKGEPVKFAFSDVALSVYQGTVGLGAILKVGRTAAPGAYTIKGKLAYQACNDHACLPPSSVPLTLTLKVVPRSTPVKSLNSDVINRIQFD